MDGRALAERIRAEVADEVRAIGGVGLTTVLVGDDPASEIYIRLKQKAAVEAGIRSEDLRLPATPIGIMALLAEYRIELDGARAVVVGRSDIVGKPVAHLLLQANATVTICHTHTRELERHTLDADVLVVAAGRAGVVTAEMVKTGATVVDVGINRTDAGTVGDVDPDAMEVAAYITPVPGGVGPMTIACLLQNAVRCARHRREA